jgi:hypothetical protein
VLESAGAAEALFGVGVVQPTHLERDEAALAQVDGLLERSLGHVPEMEAAAVATGLHVSQVEAGFVRVGFAELGTRPSHPC